MTNFIPLFLIVLALIAIVLRADFVLTLIYLIVGVYGVGRWWSRKALDSVRVERSAPERVFLGEAIPVRLRLYNTSLLPVVWLQLDESLPVGLGMQGNFRQVISLPPMGEIRYSLDLEGRKRGYYSLGPLLLFSGDIFGIAGERSRRLPESHLVVYPKIVPLSRIPMPSHSPLGTLRHNQPVFEDPSRVLGKRDYVAGDSLRRVDWKATATSGRLQVKIFEPSIALEAMIFLNLNSSEYDYRSRIQASELGIVVAASLANWLTGLKQPVGLVTNGVDPIKNGDISSTPRIPQAIPPRRGRAHLMRILDVLARVQVAETYPLVQAFRRETIHLSWGTSLLVITSNLDDELFDGLFAARRAGLHAVLIPCGPLINREAILHKTDHFGIPLYHIFTEKDLDQWRQ